MDLERRTSQRRAVSLSAQIETESGRSTVAVTKDLSTGGLLLLSRRPLELGRGATIYLLHRGMQYTVTGTVVRQQPIADSDTTLWRSQAAIAITSGGGDFARIVRAVVNNT